MKVWVLTGQTESGDDVGPYVWDYEPSLEECLVRLKRDWPEEYEAFESDEAINFDVTSTTLIREPTP